MNAVSHEQIHNPPEDPSQIPHAPDGLAWGCAGAGMSNAHAAESLLQIEP